MAKRRRQNRSSKCPEPFNSLVDLAAAFTYDYIAARRRQNLGTKRGSKIDPYKVTGAAMGAGLINDTDDILKLGGMLGIMGAFDPDDELYIDTASYAKSRDNRYAWRLNCEDGSTYGVVPEDFETRDEYNEALNAEKNRLHACYNNGPEDGYDLEDMDTADEGKAPSEEIQETVRANGEGEDADCEASPHSVPASRIPVEQSEIKATGEQISDLATISDPYENDDFHVYVYCSVELTDTHERKYYRTEDHSLKKGDKVIVPNPIDGVPVTGCIQSIELHMRFSVPQPVKETPEILGRA